MQEVVARGYCRVPRFVIRPHANITIASKLSGRSEQISVEAGNVEFIATRRKWSEETDHWYETEYVCFEFEVLVSGKQLIAVKVAEFLLQTNGDTLVLGLRSAPSIQVREQSSSSGHETQVHLLSMTGLHRKLPAYKCEACSQEDELERALYGCNDCLRKHMMESTP